MVKLTFELDDDLDDKFRKAVAVRKGIHKGVIGEAMDEAIKLWLVEDEDAKAKKR